MKTVQWGFVLMVRTAAELPDIDAENIEQNAEERMREFAERLKHDVGFDDVSIESGVLMIDGEVRCAITGDWTGDT